MTPSADHLRSLPLAELQAKLAALTGKPCADGCKRRVISRIAALTPPAPSAPTRACTRCGATGTVDDLFGWREIKGKQLPQPQCRPCRRLAAAASRLAKKEVHR